jgi:hypothetical protein
MMSLGGIPAMFNPVKNAMMAKFLYDAAGHSISPWHGTRYVTGNTTGGRVSWGGWHKDGGDFTAHRPTLIGVGEGGSETISINPTGRKGGGGIHIDQLTIHGGDDVKNEVIKAFRQLALELNLQGAERDSDG